MELSSRGPGLKNFHCCQSKVWVTLPAYATRTSRAGKTSRIRCQARDSSAERQAEPGERSQFHSNGETRTGRQAGPRNERGIVSRLRGPRCVGADVCTPEKQGTNLCACGTHRTRQRRSPSCWAEETSPNIRFLRGSARRRKQLKAVRAPAGIENLRGGRPRAKRRQASSLRDNAGDDYLPAGRSRSCRLRVSRGSS